MIDLEAPSVALEGNSDHVKDETKREALKSLTPELEAPTEALEDDSDHVKDEAGDEDLRASHGEERGEAGEGGGELVLGSSSDTHRSRDSESCVIHHHVYHSHHSKESALLLHSPTLYTHPNQSLEKIKKKSRESCRTKAGVEGEETVRVNERGEVEGETRHVTSGNKIERVNKEKRDEFYAVVTEE